MITFACTFLIQASLEILAGWVPDLYERQLYFGADKSPLYVLTPIQFVHGCCSLLTSAIIVFCTVRFEELKIVSLEAAHKIAAPFVILAERTKKAVEDTGMS